MTAHSKPADGLWTCSARDEFWQGSPFFDTRGEAVAYAADERLRFIGRVYNLSDDDVAAAFVRDWDDVDTDIREQDEWSWCEDAVVNEPNAEAREELHQLVKAWVARHSLRVPTWRVDEIEGPFDWSTAVEGKGSDDAEQRSAQGGAG